MPLPRVKPPAITPKPRVTAVGDDQAIALIGPVAVIVARDEPGPNLGLHTAKLITEIKEKYQGRGAILVIVKADVRPPSDQARQRIMESMRDCARGAICGSIVFEGTGFVAAAQRGALTMMLTMARLNYPLKVFGTLREATLFICSTLGPTAELSSPGLARAIEELRDAYAKGQLELDV